MKRILIISRNNRLASHVKKTLTESGYGVSITCKNSGVRVCDEQDTDLILFEFSTPSQADLDRITEIKKLNPEVEMIFILREGSSRPRAESFAEAIEQSTYDFLITPFSAEELRIRVNKSFEAQRLRLENKELINKLQELSITDELTQLPNRRYLQQILPLQVQSSLARNEPVSCIILDIDNFKEINDRHGHTAGDWVLKEVGVILKNLLRKSDPIIRFGGDEFVCFLMNSSSLEAIQTAERLREQIIEMNLMFGNVSIHVSASLGITTFQQHFEQPSIEQFIQKADQALYKAKLSGRNQCAYI